MRNEPVAHFLKRVALRPDGCWEWVGGYSGDGRYGAFYLHGRQLGAHVVAYRLFKGDIPAGLTVDHTCQNKGCVNPDHLEAVTSRVNTLRAAHAPATINSRKTHCPRGHAYSPENTHVSNGRRHCRTCQRVSSHAAYLRRKGRAA